MKEISKKVANYLIETFKRDPNQWVSQDDLLNEFSELKRCETASHDKCIKLWFIINELNNEDEHIYMINNNAYKVATKEEAKTWCDDYFNKRIAPMLMRYWNSRKKIATDGQGSLFDLEKFKEVFIKVGGMENDN